jgi:hypothetical protein
VNFKLCEDCGPPSLWIGYGEGIALGVLLGFVLLWWLRRGGARDAR